MGVNAYRFSLSWARLQPDGRGPLEPSVIDRYNELLDTLHDHGIAPWVALYHWQLPLALMLDRGGWLDRDTAARFADFADQVANRLGDRVAAWLTMVDPLLHMAYGHAAGVDAPGLTLLHRAVPVTAHLLLGHGLAVSALRASSSASKAASIGVAQHHTMVLPVDDQPANRQAARLYDVYHNRQFTDPILAGRLPRLLEPMFDGALSTEDLSTIAAPLDFYGVDYFSPVTVAAAPDNAHVPFTLVPPDQPSALSAPSDATGLGAVLAGLADRYPKGPPLIITDNGYPGPPQDDDQARADFLAVHLAAALDARAAGVEVIGYFHRSLFDEWEGADGFTQGYGLTAPDDTGRLRLRTSGRRYRDLIAAHR